MSLSFSGGVMSSTPPSATIFLSHVKFFYYFDSTTTFSIFLSISNKPITLAAYLRFSKKGLYSLSTLIFGFIWNSSSYILLKSLNALYMNSVMSSALYRIFASTFLSMKFNRFSKMVSILSISLM